MMRKNSHPRRNFAKHDLGDLENALSDLNQAILINPKGVAAYFHRGYVFIAKKNFAEAIADFNRCLELEPQNAWAQQGRGTALMKQVISSWR
jgi:lipoprotein NlpI